MINHLDLMNLSKTEYITLKNGFNRKEDIICQKGYSSILPPYNTEDVSYFLSILSPEY